MKDVFFRCILGIPSLMILLIPNIAHSCKNRNLNMTEVMNDFQYVIFQDLQNLLELLKSESYNNNCRKPQKSKLFCLDGMEIHSVHRMTCSVLYIAKQNDFDFNQEIIILSRQTEKTLRCSCKNQKQSRKNRNRKSKTSTIARSKTKCPQKKIQRITETISNLSLCWKKIFKFTEI
ncbi:uncharacterized protein LOC144495824 isoform X2 [Mustelus asterias]